MTASSRRLPAEWEEQDGVLLAWPHPESDWRDFLAEVLPVYVRLVAEISARERVVVVCADAAEVRASLLRGGVVLDQVQLVELPANDTWARDFGPITVDDNGCYLLLDYGFNGWGLKFAANHDNQITARLAEIGIFTAGRLVPGLILEGGSLESDGCGTLLTTSQCLLDANRNPHLDRNGLEEQLATQLGIKRFLWLENGYLAGDDTDSHIDTLARLCSPDTIAYVRCDDPEDEHYLALQAMEKELQSFRTTEGEPYRLVPLPWPEPCLAADGHRLPATYANFLIINEAVLVPTYGLPQDGQALAALRPVFPERQIVPVDCRPLIEQHGSLHCVTMQLPKGVLR